MSDTKKKPTLGEVSFNPQYENYQRMAPYLTVLLMCPTLEGMFSENDANQLASILKVNMVEKLRQLKNDPSLLSEQFITGTCLVSVANDIENHCAQKSEAPTSNIDDYYFQRQFPEIFQSECYIEYFCTRENKWDASTGPSGRLETNFETPPVAFDSCSDCRFCSETHCYKCYSWTQSYSFIAEVSKPVWADKDFRETHKFPTWTKEKALEYVKDTNCEPDKTDEYELFAIVSNFKISDEGKLENSGVDSIKSCVIKHKDNKWYLYNNGDVTLVEVDYATLKEIGNTFNFFYTPKDTKDLVTRLKKKINKEHSGTSTALSDYILSLIAQED